MTKKSDMQEGSRNGLTPDQFGGIRRSIELGSLLQHDHPEIASMRELQKAQVIRELNLQEVYNCSFTTALSALRFAQDGYYGIWSQNSKK